MVSAWGTLAFLIALSSFVPFITCAETVTTETASASTTNASGTTSTVKPTVTTTGDNGTKQTPTRRCVDLYILRPIKWLIEVPLQMIWNTIVKAKESLASLYGQNQRGGQQ